MKISHILFSRVVLSVCVAVVIWGVPTTTSAQGTIGISYAYETFPYAKLQTPIPGGEDFEIKTTSWNVGVAFPWKFADGKILMLSNLSYKRVRFTYRNIPPLVNVDNLTQAQSVQLSAFIIDSLSERWSMIVAIIPGLASDFDRKVSMDDFTLQAVLGIVRKYGTTFQLGFGLAYTRDFGPPMPLPFLYIDWKITPDLVLNGLLPVNLVLRYDLHPMVDLALAMKVRGDRYHGDSKKYGVNNPQMEYSEATLSPSARIHFTQWLHLNVEGGLAFYRNYEFLDGDISASSIDLEQTGYLRVEFVLGM